nr:DinB family protein [Sporichthya polymorpha]
MEWNEQLREQLEWHWNAQLDETYAAWVAGVRTWSTEQLAAPCGEPGYEDFPCAALVLHINREAIHHGAEIALLRDLHIRLGF